MSTAIAILGEIVSLALTPAVFTMILSVGVMLTEVDSLLFAEPPIAIVGSVYLKVLPPEMLVPTEGPVIPGVRLLMVKVRLGGSVSVIATLLAVDGPLLVTPIVYVSCVPNDTLLPLLPSYFRKSNSTWRMTLPEYNGLPCFGRL